MIIKLIFLKTDKQIFPHNVHRVLQNGRESSARRNLVLLCFERIDLRHYSDVDPIDKNTFAKEKRFEAKN